MHKRTIAVVTGSRADYGHLYWLLRAIEEDPRLKLKILVTGPHLSSTFGSTWKQITRDGFKIAAKIPVLSRDNSMASTAAAVGRGCIGFSRVLDKDRPDMLVVLGDRFEILAAVVAAYILNIPIVHLHGGEATQGVMDEGIRHAITKMSSLHGTATKTYRHRVIQMGEDPRRVFNLGAAGLDHIYRMDLLSKDALYQGLGLDLREKTLLVTFHPMTRERSSTAKQVQQLLLAVASSGCQAVFTKANADPEGLIINRALALFCRRDPSRYKFIDNMGQLLYYSALKHMDAMVGNSSSGMVEAPSFHMPVVNIGDRQDGRIKAANVLDVDCVSAQITRAIRLAFSPRFRRSLKSLKNPYDRFRDGKTSLRLKEILRKLSLDESLIKKKFYAIKNFSVD